VLIRHHGIAFVLEAVIENQRDLQSGFLARRIERQRFLVQARGILILLGLAQRGRALEHTPHLHAAPLAGGQQQHHAHDCIYEERLHRRKNSATPRAHARRSHVFMNFQQNRGNSLPKTTGKCKCGGQAGALAFWGWCGLTVSLPTGLAPVEAEIEERAARAPFHRL
jgi:hypothetical protein